MDAAFGVMVHLHILDATRKQACCRFALTGRSLVRRSDGFAAANLVERRSPRRQVAHLFCLRVNARKVSRCEATNVVLGVGTTTRGVA